jgi:hypothetical protein
MGEQLTPHFTREELQCRGCDGNCEYSEGGKPVCNPEPEALEKLEALRVELGVPFSPNSASRCPLHNARVGGAPLSQHRATNDYCSTAFDIPAVVPHETIVEAAEKVGFNGIGLYKSFVHVDNRKGRKARWGKK